MLAVRLPQRKNLRSTATPLAILFAALFCFSLPVSAQQQGPLPPPPAGTPIQPTKPPATVAPAPARRDVTTEITKEPPPIPADQIITRFAAREDEFKRERCTSNLSLSNTQMMSESNPCEPGMYPPMTNSWPRFTRHFIQDPVGFPGSYKLSLRFPMTPSNCC